MNKKDLNFAFWGTPEVGSKTLDILKSNGYIPSLIITSPDKRSGRGLHMTQSPVSIWAENNNITCQKPEKINQDFLDNFNRLNIDLSIVVAYGKILPETIINEPKLGTINIHYSLLPKYRGASPLESALLNGDTKTGVSIQQMEYKLDSGPIWAEKELNISINTTKEELRSLLISEGATLLCDVLPKIINKEISPGAQDDELATYCTKIDKSFGEINPNDNPLSNWNKYRAFYGWPGIYFFKERGGKKIRIKITMAKYENNSFVIERVVPEGKKEISYQDFLKQN